MRGNFDDAQTGVKKVFGDKAQTTYDGLVLKLVSLEQQVASSQIDRQFQDVYKRQELGCNKVALGHHLDDAVETFYMNLWREGRIGCFSPVTYLCLLYTSLVHTRPAMKYGRFRSSCFFVLLLIDHAPDFCGEPYPEELQQPAL